MREEKKLPTPLSFELVSQDQPAQDQASQPSDAVVSQMRERLSQCVEEDESGRQRLTVALPDRNALDNLAQTLARLLVAGSGGD